MGAIHPFSAHTPWVLADNSLGLVEVLAIIGVVIWVAGLTWLVLADVIHAADKHHHHPGRSHGPHRPSR